MRYEELLLRYETLNKPMGDFVYIIDVDSNPAGYENARPIPIARPIIVAS